ncbi:21407_t:CDS:2 [Rhizophagus irregularis]|nr:21407_t:CDS:2 [Rhizophagus irregularis]
MDSPDTLNSLLSKFNKVVKDKSQTPSLNIQRVIKDGYEPIKLEGNDKVFSPKISNKDNSDTKKTQQKNNINSSFIEHELPSKDFILEDLSQQSFTQPPSLFPTHTAGRKLSTIVGKTELVSNTIQSSELDTKILRPSPALSSSSSSDGLEVSDLSVSLEEKFDKVNCVTIKNRRVYNNNIDTLPKILKDQDISENQVETFLVGEEGEQITSDISNISSNNNLIPINTTHILSSNLNSSDYPTSSILNSTSSSSTFSDSISIHSDKSILGDIIYNSIPSSPPSITQNISSTPLKNTKTGLHREDRYPSPRTYFSRKSGPMGDLSDSTKERGRMGVEGWPASHQRRMQLGSPRLKSLSDLVEESSEQQESSSCRDNPLPSSNLSSQNVFESSCVQIPIKQNKESQELELKAKKQAEILESKNDEKDILSKPVKFFNRTSNSRYMELISNNDESQSFGKRQSILSSSKRTFNNPKTSLLQDMQSISEEEKDDDVIDKQDKTKGRNEKRLSSGSFSSKLEKSIEESKSEPLKRSSGGRISRLLSIQSRRTLPHLNIRTPLSISISETEDEEEETEMSSDNTSGRYILPSDQSDVSPSPSSISITPISSVPMTPITPKSNSWRWPKRPFSPAREKHKEEQVKSDDNPSDHIGKVGNIWAKKTLGQLRKYHQRQSPSILSRGLSLPSPLKEPVSPLQSPVSDISDSKKSPAVSIPEQPLETINEEEDEEIGIWSSEEVDLTDSEKKPPTPTSINSILNSPILEEPQGMKVSPEHLTVAGGPSVIRDSPNASTTSLTLRSNPSSSSLAKHNAKPLFETTFTISNITDKPLKYEILWPAFRFDITPAYGTIKPQSVTVVKISVMHKHLTVGSKREDSKKLIGMLKGSEKNGDKPLMSRTRILVLCENGERKEVVIDIVPVKKETKGEIESIRSSSKNARDENGNFISRSGKSFSRTVDDLIKAARARAKAKKQTRPEDKPRSTKTSKGKSTAVTTTSSTGKNLSAPVPRRSSSSKPPSRSSSPEGSNRNRVVRKKASSSSLRSRPNTPDIARSRTPDESKSIKQLPQRKNFLYVGVPGHINCSPTTIRETNHSVFRIQNPTNKPVTWHLTTATNPFLRRSESSNNSAQKINDEVFLIMKTSGFLRPGQTEKVVVSFRPVIVGTYHQNFMLEDSMNAEGAGGLGGVSVRIQGEGKVDASTSVRPDIKRSTSSRAKDFEVSETEVNIPATRVGKRRSVGIKIRNPSSQLIRIKCKIELNNCTNESSAALSIPLSSVQIKPHAFVLLPVRFQPKEIGEIRGIVKLQAVGRTEIEIDIVAEGVSETVSEL